MEKRAYLKLKKEQCSQNLHLILDSLSSLLFSLPLPAFLSPFINFGRLRIFYSFKKWNKQMKILNQEPLKTSSFLVLYRFILLQIINI